MAYENILVERHEGYAVIALNRPKANALNKALLTELRTAVEELDADAAFRCILITSNNPRFFSAGADIPSIMETFNDPFQADAMTTAGLGLVDRIEESGTPVVAVINGVAVGGGCELLLSCHMRIAADTAQFGQPEVNIGIVPGWGGCHRLPRMIGEARAMDWILTGRMVSAQEAHQAGLVAQVVPADKLMDAAHDLGKLLASKPPVAVRGILRAVRECSLYPERGKSLEAEAFIEAARSKDATEGVTAFLEKRAPRFTGE